jgi:lipoate synthase
LLHRVSVPGNDVGQALVDQATAQELLKLIHRIADPCEDIIAKAGALAGDPSQQPEIQQASADLAATVEQLFQIAHYIMNATPRL